MSGKTNNSISQINCILPENETPVLLMTLGYPADDSKPMNLHHESKDMTEIVKML